MTPIRHGGPISISSSYDLSDDVLLRITLRLVEMGALFRFLFFPPSKAVRIFVASTDRRVVRRYIVLLFLALRDSNPFPIGSTSIHLETSSRST